MRSCHSRNRSPSWETPAPESLIPLGLAGRVLVESDRGRRGTSRIALIREILKRYVPTAATARSTRTVVVSTFNATDGTARTPRAATGLVVSITFPRNSALSFSELPFVRLTLAISRGALQTVPRRRLHRVARPRSDRGQVYALLDGPLADRLPGSTRRLSLNLAESVACLRTRPRSEVRSQRSSERQVAVGCDHPS